MAACLRMASPEGRHAGLPLLIIEQLFRDIQVAENIVWHDRAVTKQMHVDRLGQKPCLLWFTGLSGSGKSTLANALELALYKRGISTYLLDGDNVRHGLNKDLGFSDKDRVENIRRIGEASRLFVDAGLIVLSAFISPFRSDRDMVRHLLAENEFIEIYMSTPLPVCERRDPKGLYKKARNGEIKQFTGIDSPYEAPEHPEIAINSADHSIEKSVELVTSFLQSKGIIK